MKKPRDGDSLIVAHARRELEMAGAFEKTEDYDGRVGRALLDLIKSFDRWSQGSTALMQIIHQGFNSLITGELLAPPTDDPEEWQRVNRKDGKDVLRNLRSPFYVSMDGGKSWTNTATNEKGLSANHLTGEVPKDGNSGGETKKMGSNTNTVSRSGSEGANQATPVPPEAAAKDPVSPVETGELNSGVEPEGSKDPKPAKKAKAKPKKGKKK